MMKKRMRTFKEAPVAVHSHCAFSMAIFAAYAKNNSQASRSRRGDRRVRRKPCRRA